MDTKEATEKIQSWLSSRGIELSEWDVWYIENLMQIVAATSKGEGMKEATNIFRGGKK